MPIHTLAKNLSPNNQAPCRENSSPKEFHRTAFRLILSAFRQFGDFETKRRLFVLSSRSEHIIHVTGITNLLTTYFLPSLDKVDIYSTHPHTQFHLVHFPNCNSFLSLHIKTHSLLRFIDDRTLCKYGSSDWNNYLPMQKFENMLFRTSSVVTSPVISPM